MNLISNHYGSWYFRNSKINYPGIYISWSFKFKMPPQNSKEISSVMYIVYLLPQWTYFKNAFCATMAHNNNVHQGSQLLNILSGWRLFTIQCIRLCVQYLLRCELQCPRISLKTHFHYCVYPLCRTFPFLNTHLREM